MTKTLRQALEDLAEEMDDAVGGALTYTALNGLRKNAHDQIMYVLEDHPEAEKTPSPEKPVLLQKKGGEGDLWVLPEDVLRVEDTRAMLSEYDRTVIYFRDGSHRYLEPLTAAKTVATLWPESTTNKEAL